MSAIGKAPKPRRPFSAIAAVTKFPLTQGTAIFVVVDLPEARFTEGQKVRVTIEPLDPSQIRHRGKVK